MPEITIHTNASREAILAALRSLPKQVVNGTLAESLLTRCGLVLLKRIREAFVVKSTGGTDEAGDRWAPLAPATIAHRRKKYEAKALLGSSSKSNTASDKQKERWWKLYRQLLVSFKGDQRSAAKFAWILLKKEGVAHKFDKYRTGKIDILRDTGALYKSLAPGSTSSQHVFKMTRSNELKMGTKRPGAAAHHYGALSRNLPQRRLWPPVNKWPSGWWDDILKQAQEAMVEIIIDTIKNV